MSEPLHYHFEVDGEDFLSAGEASSSIKKVLRQLGLPGELIRRTGIAMYEGEINMVIHAKGGTADVDIFGDHIRVVLADRGPGIPDVDLAMTEGYSTAPDYIRDLGFGAGIGLSNMKKSSDELRIDTRVGVGTTVTMVFRMP